VFVSLVDARSTPAGDDAVYGAKVGLSASARVVVDIVFGKVAGYLVDEVAFFGVDLVFEHQYHQFDLRAVD